MRKSSAICLALAIGLAAFATAVPGATADGHHDDPIAKLKSTAPICKENDEAKSGATAEAAKAAGGALPSLATEPGKKFFANLIANNFTVSGDGVQTYFTAAAVVGPAVAGIFWAILNCCTCYWCCCMRGVCWLCPNSCKCCKCIPALRPYTKLEKILPIAPFSLFSLLALIFTFIGMVNGIGRMTGTIIDTACFLDTFSTRIIGFIDGATAPLNGPNNKESFLAVLDGYPYGCQTSGTCSIEPATKEIGAIVDKVNGCTFTGDLKTNPDGIYGCRNLGSPTGNNRLPNKATTDGKYTGKCVTATETGPCALSFPGADATAQTANMKKYNLNSAVNDLAVYISFASYQAGLGVAANKATATPTDVACGKVFPTAQKSLTTAAKAAQDAANAFNEAMVKIKDDLKSNLNDNKDLKKSIDDAAKSISDMKANLNDQIENIKKPALDNAKTVKDNQSTAQFVYFGWVFLSLFFALIGLALMKFSIEELDMDEPPKYAPEMPIQVWKLKCPGACGSRFVACCGWFMFLAICIPVAAFGGIFLTVGTVGADLCTVVPTLPQKIVGNTGNQRLVNIVEGCFGGGNPSLLTILNMTGQVEEPLNKINFDDMEKKFAAGNVEPLELKALMDVYIKVTKDQKQKVTVGGAPEQEVDINIADDCSEGKPFAASLKYVIDQTYYVNNLISGYYQNCPSQFTGDERRYTNPKRKCNEGSQYKIPQPVPDQILQKAKDLITTLKEIVGVQNGEKLKGAKPINMFDALRCGWIKTTWDELSDIVCGGAGLMRSIGVIGMAMFALGFLAIPYAITLIFMNKRYGGHGPVARDDGEIPTAKAEEVNSVDKQNPLDFA